MKLVMFSRGPEHPRPGVLGTDGRVREIGPALLPEWQSPRAMRALIDRFETLRAALEKLERSDDATPLSAAYLHAPLPRPNKILSCLGNRLRGVGVPPEAVHLFLKGGSALAGAGSTVELPQLGGREVFIADGSLGVVIQGPVQKVSLADWRRAVFGYTGVIDITARTVGLFRWNPGTCLGAACDAFAPTGPVLVTADEMGDPAELRIRLENNGAVWQEYVVGSMHWQVPDLVHWATRVMTLYSGDMISCAGDPAGQGAIQENDRVALEIQGVGRLEIQVSDPLHRRPARDIRVGARIETDASIDVLLRRVEILRENAL